MRKEHFDGLADLVGRQTLSSRIEGVVSVRQPLGRAEGVRVVAQVGVEDQGRRQGLLVELQDLAAAVRRGVASVARVAVVEDDQR